MNMLRWACPSGVVDRNPRVTDHYKNTQKVQWILTFQCGPKFKFDRAFLVWTKDGNHKTIEDVVDEWTRWHI